MDGILALPECVHVILLKYHFDTYWPFCASIEVKENIAFDFIWTKSRHFAGHSKMGHMLATVHAESCIFLYKLMCPYLSNEALIPVMVMGLYSDSQGCSFGLNSLLQQSIGGQNYVHAVILLK